MTLKIGDKAPNFNLPSDQGSPVALSSMTGKKVVLYFYPKDDTSGCTAQACDFRDSITQLRSLNAAVLGISKDSVQSHKKFKEKYGLNFPLLSDESSGVCEQYGVWVQKSMYGRNYMGIERTTFLIDEKGIIRNIWRKVSVPGHAAEINAAIGGKAANSNTPPAKKPAGKKTPLKKPAVKASKKPKAKIKPAVKSATKSKSKKPVRKQSARKPVAKKSVKNRAAAKSKKRA